MANGIKNKEYISFFIAVTPMRWQPSAASRRYNLDFDGLLSYKLCKEKKTRNEGC